MAWLSILGPVKDVIGAHVTLTAEEKRRHIIDPTSRVSSGKPPPQRPADDRGKGAWLCDRALELLSGRAKDQPQPVEVSLVMTDQVLLPAAFGGKAPADDVAVIPGWGVMPGPRPARTSWICSTTRPLCGCGGCSPTRPGVTSSRWTRCVAGSRAGCVATSSCGTRPAGCRGATPRPCRPTTPKPTPTVARPTPATVQGCANATTSSKKWPAGTSGSSPPDSTAPGRTHADPDPDRAGPRLHRTTDPGRGLVLATPTRRTS